MKQTSQNKYGRYTQIEVERGDEPGTWKTPFAIIQVEEGISAEYGDMVIVQPYYARVFDNQTGELLFEEPMPNWSQAKGRAFAWYQAQQS